MNPGGAKNLCDLPVSGKIKVGGGARNPQIGLRRHEKHRYFRYLEWHSS